MTCGKVPPVVGHVECQDCREMQRLNRTNRYHRRKQGGLCPSCGKPLDLPNIESYCSVCRDRYLKYTRTLVYDPVYRKQWRRKNATLVKTYNLRREGRKRNAQGETTEEQLSGRIEYYDGRCYVCGAPYEHIDHVIAVAKGGSNWPANLRPICGHCNSSKGDKLLSVMAITRDYNSGFSEWLNSEHPREQNGV